MAEWAKDVKAEFPDLTIFGEVLTSSPLTQAYFTEGNTVNRGFDTQLPGVIDGAVKQGIYDALNNGNYGVMNLHDIIAQDFLYQDVNRNVVFLDNHDMSRILSVLGENISKYKSAMAMLLTLRGVPQLYYGDEILMKNFSDPDGLVRSDFEGGWLGDKHNKFTAAGRDYNENDAFNYVSKLANYRKHTPALQTGKLMQYIPENGIYVYFRYDDNKTIMVVYNGSDNDQKTTTTRYSERIRGAKKAINVITGETVDLSELTVGNKSTLVLEIVN
jgi:glycosidase